MNKIFITLLVLLALAYGAYQLYFIPKFSHGAEAPDFSAQLIDGSNFNLKDLRGKYVLLDFWGSWCGPCRRDNPNLVALYNELDQEFFTILSVAVETNEKSWKRAIEKDGLIWPHHIVQKERFKSEIPKLYGVREIPTKYLLNREGKIIAVNPNNERVKELLGKG